MKVSVISKKIILILKFPQVLFSVKMLASYYQVLESYFSLTCACHLRHMPLDELTLDFVFFVGRWRSVD